MTEPRWTLHPPPAEAGPARLEQVRAFRGELLHDGGRRPGFGSPAGPFDADPLDLPARHVVATEDGRPAAVLRVLEWPAAGTGGVCARLLGADRLREVLAGQRPDDLWEGSGWAVRPGPGRAALALRTLAAGFAVARSLGRYTLVGACGTRYGQLHRVLTAGLRCVEGVDPIPSPPLADDLRLVHGHLDQLRPGFRTLVDEIGPRIQGPVPDQSPGAGTSSGQARARTR